LDRAGQLNCELIAEDKTLILRPVNETKSPVATLKWGENLQTFSATQNARKQVQRVEWRGYDYKAKEAIVGSYEAPSTQTKSGAAVANKAFGKSEEVVVNRPIRTKAEGEVYAKARLEQLSRNYITSHGKTIGMPSLWAGVTVKIQGTGQFDGDYRLSSVTHSIDSGGFTTNFRGEWFSG
jgi:phage protein D